MEKEEKMLLCRLEAPSVMCYGTIRARVVPSVTEVKTGDTLFAALASHSKKVITLKSYMLFARIRRFCYFYFASLFLCCVYVACCVTGTRHIA